MQVSTIIDSLIQVQCDALIICVYDDPKPLNEKAVKLDTVLGGLINNVFNEDKTIAKNAATTTLLGFTGIGARRLILLGMGKREELTLDLLRKAAGAVIRQIAKFQAKNIVAVLPDEIKPEVASKAFTEGILLGNYRFNYYKTNPDEKNLPEQCNFSFIENNAVREASVKIGIQAGKIVADAVNLTRDMVNHPSNYMTPAKIAWQASQVAGQLGLEIEILDRNQIEGLGMNSFLAVARGSNEPPKLITIKYQGAPGSDNTFAFIGKGITFDSGGISLKPGDGMHEMKDDMAGAATVLGAVSAIAKLKLGVNILAIMPCTENLPSGLAFKPGDVLTAMSGKTIEVISTDAEGRLILADALTYARKLGATHIVDLATLTGACVVALGNITSGVMSNNDALKTQILKAAKISGERMWELPLFDEYKDQIKSQIADIKNTGGRPAGAITAAMFLAEFAEKTPWVHIDIAGTVSTDKDSGYNVKGATGAGVRTLIELARERSEL